MNSKVWGQYLWRLLHTITYSYPNKCSQKLKGKYIDIFYCLRNIIPCSICKIHYRKRLNEFPVERFLNNKDNFINWLIKLHNEVNVGLYKRTVSRKEADSIYLDDKNKLKYDFKDFVILFRLFSMMSEHNFPEIQKFIKLVFEIYPNDFLLKNAKTSFKNIKKINISSDLNKWIVEFDTELSKSTNKRSNIIILDNKDSGNKSKKPTQVSDKKKQKNINTSLDDLEGNRYIATKNKYDKFTPNVSQNQLRNEDMMKTFLKKYNFI